MKQFIQFQREKVNQLPRESCTSHAIVCHNLQKITQEEIETLKHLPCKDYILLCLEGNALMIGHIKPTSGTTFVQGLDIQTHMDEICTRMGVCPQHEEYSGGMKRMLSVAISLIGDPKEPSTGLDPTNGTTYGMLALIFSLILSLMKLIYMVSAQIMEEAKFLCDRQGFFVNGSLQCIGNPKEKDKYGGSYMFTTTISSDRRKQIMTSLDQEKELENIV
ncbi:abc transporter a family member 7 [Quercus suber]|uniref:Abc transporter a family member 7 n=1 Tax=Quercus suber TaxID=58331 RepID=A0AAW0KA82_QUESU